jgi:hypothetical protein
MKTLLLFNGEASSSTLVGILASHGKRKHKETTRIQLKIKEIYKIWEF